MPPRKKSVLSREDSLEQTIQDKLARIKNLNKYVVTAFDGRQVIGGEAEVHIPAERAVQVLNDIVPYGQDVPAGTDLAARDLHQYLEKYKLVNIGLRLYYRKTTEPGGSDTLDFERRPAQAAIFREVDCAEAINVCFKKCVQVGISELANLASIEWARSGRTVIYVQPNLDLRHLFINLRVNDMFRMREYYAQMLKIDGRAAADSVTIKKLGSGEVIYLGANSPAGFTGTPAQATITDELDQCNEDYLPLLADRLMAAKSPIQWTIGNPSIPGFGISKAFDESDQRWWHIKCTGCNEWQVLDFFQHLVVQEGDREYKVRDTKWTPLCAGDPQIGCLKCGKALDRFSKGNYVPKYPGAPRWGYQMSHMFGPPTRDLRHLLYDPEKGFFYCIRNDTNLTVFYNSRLGLDYTAEGAALTPELLWDAEKIAPYELPQHKVFTPDRPWQPEGVVTLGADPGESDIPYWISDHPIVAGRMRSRLIACGSARSFAELSGLMTTWQVTMGVVDYRPQSMSAREFQAAHPGKIWLVEFHTGHPTTPLDWGDPESSDRMCKIARTEYFDNLVSGFRNSDQLLPVGASGMLMGPRDKTHGQLWAQLLAPKRAIIMRSGSPMAVWREKGLPDHLACAAGYSEVAAAAVAKFGQGHFMLRNLVNPKDGKVQVVTEGHLRVIDHALKRQDEAAARWEQLERENKEIDDWLHFRTK